MITTKLILSVSDLKLHATCPQKYHYLHTERRGTRSIEVALDVGTIVHAALAAKILNRDWKPVVQAQLERVATLAEEIDAPGVVMEKVTKDLHALLPVVEHWQLPAGWQPLMVETVIALDRGHYLLPGRLDCVIRYNGKLWHLQHKTIGASRNVDTYAAGIATDWHEAAYALMIEEEFGERPIGTILNCLRKFGRKTTEKEPEKAIVVRYLDRDWRCVERAMEDMDRRARWIIEETEGTRGIEQTRDACTGFFGSRLCTYKGVCDLLESLDDPKFVDISPRYKKEDA